MADSEGAGGHGRHRREIIAVAPRDEISCTVRHAGISPPSKWVLNRPCLAGERPRRYLNGLRLPRKPAAWARARPTRGDQARWA